MIRMELNSSSFNTHDWIGRRLILAPGEALIQMGCRECGREFVDECASGERFAVHVSIFKLHRLSAEVTARWLSQNCLGERLMADDADRQTLREADRRQHEFGVGARRVGYDRAREPASVGEVEQRATPAIGLTSPRPSQ